MIDAEGLFRVVVAYSAAGMIAIFLILAFHTIVSVFVDPFLGLVGAIGMIVLWVYIVLIREEFFQAVLDWAGMSDPRDDAD